MGLMCSMHAIVDKAWLPRKCMALDSSNASALALLSHVATHAWHLPQKVWLARWADG